MQEIILAGSIIGIVNSFILVIYSLVSKKGRKTSNILFALFILMLTLRISKSILLTFSDGFHDFLLTIGLSGFMAIGPVYYYFTKSILNDKFKLKWIQALHLAPAVIFTFMWVFLDQIRNDGNMWHIFYRSILLQYMLYISIAVLKIFRAKPSGKLIKMQLNIIAAFLLLIWFAYLLNEVAGFPYISGAILYSILIYFSLIIIINKGYIINVSAPKYTKTGLHEEESERLYSELKDLFERDFIYRDNTLSLTKLTKLLKTTTHALSQVINEKYEMTFFELLGFYRINEAKKSLIENDHKISEIAYEVGYNSLSAFNTAFKKLTGLTPTSFRNERKN